MVREEHISFTSKEGSIKIHGMRWIPDGEIRAVVQLVHGMSEHIERYREFAMFLAQNGILVVGHDHIGHGKSIGSEQDYGYFAKENGNQVLVEDMHQMLLLTKQAYANLPYIMFGHSMGSFLTRKYLCCHGDELDGAVLCGTGDMPAPVLKAGMLLCRIVAALRGWKARSELVRMITFGSYNAGFKPNRTLCDWLTRDEKEVDTYIADPKCGFTFTLNGYYNLFLTIYEIGQTDYLKQMPKELPVLFVAGEKDPVGNCGKGVRAAAARFKKIGMKKISCKLYPQDRHEILNELDKKTVYKDVLAWIAKVLKNKNQEQRNR